MAELDNGDDGGEEAHDAELHLHVFRDERFGSLFASHQMGREHNVFPKNGYLEVKQKTKQTLGNLYNLWVLSCGQFYYSCCESIDCSCEPSAALLCGLVLAASCKLNESLHERRALDESSEISLETSHQIAHQTHRRT